MTIHRCTCPGCQARREEQARLSAAEAEAARDQAAVDAAVATCPTCAGDQECVKHETWRCALVTDEAARAFAEHMGARP